MRREVRKYFRREFVHQLGVGASADFWIESDMRDAGRFSFVKKLREGFASRAESAARSSQRFIGVVHQVEIARYAEWLEMLRAEQLPNMGVPLGSELRQQLWGWRGANEAVRVFSNPTKVLLSTTDCQGWGPLVRGFGYKVQRAFSTSETRRREVRETLFDDRTIDTECVAESVASRFEINSEERILGRPVTGRKPDDHPATRELVERCDLLSKNERFSHRQDDAGRTQRDVPCECAEVGDVDQRVEDLSDVAVVRVVKRNVAHPERGEAELLSLLCHGDVVAHRGRGAGGMRFERKYQSYCELVLSEESCVCGLPCKRGNGLRSP